MKYYNVELDRSDSLKFWRFLKNRKIKFETSGAGCGLTHFEVLLSSADLVQCDLFLSKL